MKNRAGAMLVLILGLVAFNKVYGMVTENIDTYGWDNLIQHNFIPFATQIFVLAALVVLMLTCAMLAMRNQ